MAPVIRAKALCVCQHQGRILVSRAHDPVKNEWYWRPLGGSIEFGESSAHAVTREMQEEIGADVEDLRCLGTLENIFTYAGQPGHEIVFIYDARLADASLYLQSSLAGVESDGARFTANWQSLDDFPALGPLYPTGLLALLRGTT